MKIYSVVLVVLFVYAAPTAAAEEFELPAEVTPELRAACENDVRRLCIGKRPTIAKVKSCVAKKFFKLGRRCQTELTTIGITGL
jgi:hypothetical protein